MNADEKEIIVCAIIAFLTVVAYAVWDIWGKRK